MTRMIYWKQFWSRGWTTTHLVPDLRRVTGVEVGDRSLCGEFVDHSSYREIEANIALQPRICKKCQKAAAH